ncbi:hypothetical protein [Acidiferrobacter sp.]|uniref:hypothetical protein n=1 Tax=Acidiferrobacter sp. TaxID=1872107 RepID=UPI00263429E5|nr:hypothetical protein [Acidiferrobacter sp.]
MRTTLTIDEQVAIALQETARRSGKSYKAVVNEALRLGRHAMTQPQARRYASVPSSLGPACAELDLDQARAMADLPEEGAIIQDLGMRK